MGLQSETPCHSVGARMRALLFAGVAVVLTTTGSASAGNEDDFFPGNRAGMTAGAVSATVADGSAVYFNPAGLSAISGNRIDVLANAYALRRYAVPAFLRTSAGARQDASVGEFVSIPTEIAYVRRVTPDAAIGVGYFVPRGESSLLRARVADTAGDARSSFAVDATSTSAMFHLAAAIGVRASARVRWGAGLFGTYESLVSSTAFLGTGSREGRLLQTFQFTDLKTFSRMSLHARAGLQVDLGEGFTLGLVARGPRLQVRRSGEDSQNVSRAVASPGGEALLTSSSQSVTDAADQVGLLEWGRYHAALAYRANAATLSVELDVMPPLQSSATQVDRQLTVNGRVGVLYPVSETLHVGAGVFTDRATTRGSDYTNFLGSTVGVELADIFRLATGEPAKRFVLTSSFALRYVYGAGPTSTLLADPVATTTSSVTSTQTIHEIALQVGSGMRF